MERHPLLCWETGIIKSTCDLELSVYLNIDWSEELRLFCFCLRVQWEPVLYAQCEKSFKPEQSFWSGIRMVTAELLLSLHSSVKYVLSGKKRCTSWRAENELQDGEDK